MTTWDEVAGQYLEYVESLYIFEHYGSLADNAVKISDCLNYLCDQVFSGERIKSYSEINTWYRGQDAWIYMAMKAFGCMKTMSPSLTSADVNKLLCSKQKDYGKNNISRFGIVGIIIRLNDKLARLLNLLDKNEESEILAVAVEDEPIYQTYMDIVGYCVIALMFTTKVKLSPNYTEIQQFFLPMSDEEWQRI